MLIIVAVALRNIYIVYNIRFNLLFIYSINNLIATADFY